MIQIKTETCVGCGTCVNDCFPEALALSAGKAALVEPGNCLRCGHCIALCPVEAVFDDQQNMDEVRDCPPADRQVDPDNLLRFMQFRRATRHFKPDPIPQEILDAILDAGRWSPTAKNRQSTSFLVVRQAIPQLKAAALKRLRDVGQVMLMKGVPADEARRAQKFIDWCKQLRKDPDFDPLFFHAPALVMAVSDKEGKLDAAAAAAYMELEANAQGLGVLYSGYFAAAAQGNEEIRGILGLRDGEELVRCLVLGRPDIAFRRIPPRDAAKVEYL